MQALSLTKAFSALCKATGKWGLFIQFHCGDGKDDWKEIYEAAPFLLNDECLQIVADESGFFLFDDETEMERHYDLVVGDDGPTKSNPYNGPMRIYALTCDPSGQTLNENT